MKFLSSERLSEHKYKTPEGYLICTDAILARTGKQSYQRNEIFADAADDDTIIEIDRPSEEVFAPETLASFENKPVTVEHPDENVGPDNYNNLAVGFVRDVHKGTVNGQEVMLGTLVITDAKTIEEIENGEHTDLSCGYDCDIIDEANPQQRNIRGNHVALCQQGRAGIARIVDSVKDSFKVGEKFKTAGGYIKKIIKIGPNAFGTPSVFLQTEADTTGPTMIITIDVFEDDIKRGIYTKINDSIKDRAIPSSLINELNRKLEEFKRRGYDESDLEINVEGNKIWFTGELSYNTHWKLAEELDKILQKYNKDAYFDAETTGRWFAVYDSKIARIVNSVKDDIVFDYTKADLDKAKEMLITAKTDDEKRLIKSLIAKIEFELKSKELNDEDNNNENEDEFIQAHSDAKAMYEEIISREAMTEEEARRLVYKYFKGKDSITDVVSKIERYKNVDIYKDEANNLLADFSKTSTGKRLQRLNTKNINKAKEIIDDMIDFITDSLIQSSSKDEQKPYAITPRRRWQSSKKLEQFFTSLEEAKYAKNASEKADGIDYVVVDTRTMRIVDGKKTFTIKTEDKDNVYIAKIKASNAIDAFNKFNNKK